MSKRILFLVYSGLVLTLCFSSVVNASPNLLLGWLLQPQFKTVKLNPFYNNVLVNPGNVSVNGSLCLWNASVGGYWQCVSAWNQNVSINVTANLTYFYYPNQTSFLYLNDTPKSYVGNASNCVVVNSTETGLTFKPCVEVEVESSWNSNFSVMRSTSCPTGTHVASWNGSWNCTVDIGSGGVGFGNSSFVSVFEDAPQLVSGSGVFVDLNYSSVSYDSNSEFDASTGVFTAKEDGDFEVCGSLAVEGVDWSQGGFLELSVFKS
jgi:hypothetical protein